MTKKKDYEYDTLDTVDNLLTFAELTKQVTRIAAENNVPMENICLAAFDDQLLVEERFIPE